MVSGLVEEVTPQAVELRRLLHRHPEPGNEEHETTALIVAALEQNGIPVKTRSPRTGLWADIGASPRVGFRADLDALPIEEPKGNVPRSINPGWMHACGHDAHAAIATGVAMTLARIEGAPPARILFQPAEESAVGGANELVAEGLVDGLKGLMAFHVDPSLEVGRIGSRSGAITGSADSFFIKLAGPGGHTSRPHRTVDLVDASARVVRELPNVVSRAVDSRSPIVTVFGSIHGGDAPNVIPTEVSLTGTVRTLERSLWDGLAGLLEKSLASIVAVTGADFTLEYHQGVAPVVNDDSIVKTVCSILAENMGEDVVVSTETSMGGEDFSAYLDIVPGAMFRLGSQSGGGDLHSASFKVNEASIGFGIRAGVVGLLGMAETV